MKQRLFAFATALVLLFGLVPLAASADAVETPAHVSVARPVNSNYAAIKAAIDARTSVASPGIAPSVGTAPVTGALFAGLGPNGGSPSDATGAISPDQYIELVNSKIGVYSRAGAVLSSNTQATWTGFGSAASGDGQILWDTSDQRFYYAMLYITTSSNELAFGFSKGATPSANPADWCSYHSTFGSYGSDFPDYPKLGQSSDFLLFGVNRFNSAGTAYLGSDVAWATKPGAGPIAICPDLASMTLGVQPNLLNADGTQASTPVPGQQTDVGSTGYVVANEDPGTATANRLSIYAVTKNLVTGAAIISGPTPVAVAPFAYPPSAPQATTTFKLDTLDARLMNAWVAPDPNRGGALALWTQHTVAASAGGLGAEVRWYELNPVTGATFQRGVAHTSSKFAFDGAIAPDRNGTAHLFGGNMVLVFNLSSTTTLPVAAMVSKIGANVQSGIVGVAGSSKADVDYTCSSTVPCRWGDYAGASPDPGSTASGQVWASIQLANGGSRFVPGWKTVNWSVRP